MLKYHAIRQAQSEIEEFQKAEVIKNAMSCDLLEARTFRQTNLLLGLSAGAATAAAGHTELQKGNETPTFLKMFAHSNTVSLDHL